MSDHMDGPRQAHDPSVDVTDLFAFTSPQNAGRTVLAVDVFPFAGASATFSNAAYYAIVLRRAMVEGLGDAAKFKTGTEEFRFSCRFETIEAGTDGKPIQRGTCTLPGGQQLRLVVNDENGVATPDGVFRIFAGLRSDPFVLGWIVGEQSPTKVPSFLQHDNVLSIVIEFDTQRVLDPAKGSLFAAIAETTPIPRPQSPVDRIPSRFDWIGRPEQSNLRLNNPGLIGVDDLRDLWNQQMPFAIAEELKPVFRKRLLESLANLDMRDGKADWTPAALTASAEVFLDDYLLFDVSKPITDTSFLEVEKSTLDGVAYQTGGGRTPNTLDFDILLTWLVNRDKGEFMRGGSAGATKPATNTFPYLATPSVELQSVVTSVDLGAPPDRVWALIGMFGAMWHPLIANVKLTGTGVGQLRAIETIDGKRIVERLDAIDPVHRFYRYTMISGVPAADYTGTLDVKPKGSGSSIEWRVQYRADGQPNLMVKTIVATFEKVGLDSLKTRFG
jgi:hypothetical protein